MTTILQARDELDTALTSGGVPIADAPGAMAVPYGVIFGDGVVDIQPNRRQARASFRMLLVAGGWEQAETGRTLTGMVQTALDTLLELDGWQMGEVRSDVWVTLAAGQMLAANVTASRMVDI